MPDPQKCKEKGDYDMRKMQRCARISTISTRLAFINAADLALQQSRLMSGGKLAEARYCSLHAHMDQTKKMNALICAGYPCVRYGDFWAISANNRKKKNRSVRWRHNRTGGKKSLWKVNGILKMLGKARMKRFEWKTNLTMLMPTYCISRAFNHINHMVFFNKRS